MQRKSNIIFIRKKHKQKEYIISLEMYCDGEKISNFETEFIR